MIGNSEKRKQLARRPSRPRRAGAILVWTGMMLVILLGMVGLVVDGGLLMAGHRHAQNLADSAATAAAMARLRGKSAEDAIADGEAYVQAEGLNNEASAEVTINNPPSTGPYSGSAGHFEALVSLPLPTYFIHVLPGVASGSTVNARAVAGAETIVSGEGVITLNPNAKPGLDVSGNGTVIVEGDIIVNSLGGGVDEEGNEVGSGQPGLKVSNNATVQADNILVAGGVNDPENLSDINEGEDPLDAGTSIMYPDPYLDLPTPTVANGVLNIDRGSPEATSGSLKLNNPNDDLTEPNFIDTSTTPSTLVLRPGIYKSISITGGNVRFEPGIYVLTPPGNVSIALKITGGNISADGIMFYNTGANYDPVTGAPDINDLDQTPGDAGTSFGRVQINAGVPLHPINYDTYAGDYPTSSIEAFDGFLFYQRRWNTEILEIEGNSSSGDLTGTLYSKWGPAKLTGQGTYDAQFAVGEMDLAGNGTIVLNFDGNNLGQAPRIFLVE